MREILFRGRGNTKYNDGEWYYGVPIRDFEGDWQICTDNSKRVVIPETIGQYTGLKDKNGTKIFEGDIVLVPYIDPIFKCTWNDTSPCERAIVKYCNGMFYVEYIESGDKFTLSAMDGYMKIIGNIYDNPELLGGNNNVTCQKM